MSDAYAACIFIKGYMKTFWIYDGLTKDVVLLASVKNTINISCHLILNFRRKLFVVIRILCKIWGFHGRDYEEWRLLGCCVVALAITDVSEERNASIIKVTRIGELGTTLAVTSNRRQLRRNTIVWEYLMMEALRSSELSALTRATRRYIPEDGILHQ
jgi:hypothetical protein